MVRTGFQFILALCCVAILALSPAQAQSRQEASALTRALDAVKTENWSAAQSAARASGEVGRDVVQWLRLRAPEGSFSEYRDFLARRGDWPGLKLLRRRGEASIDENTPLRQVVAYFEEQKPQTGHGALYYARALRETGNPNDARAQIVRAWQSLPVKEDEDREIYLGRYAGLLDSHHNARLDHFLWRADRGEIAKMMPLASAGWQALARARMGLRRDEDGVDGLIEAVPSSLQNDPGLAWERFTWRARKGRYDSAAELAISQAGSSIGTGEANRWGHWQRAIARQLMRDGKNRAAYRLAATHGMTSGSNFADLEWLAGYIALRKLNDAETAARHFARFKDAVFTPISLGRAGYWQGRAQEALGNDARAAEFYRAGAQFQTSFYGQLAAERVGVSMDERLTGGEEFGNWRNAPFLKSTVFQAGFLLHQAGDLSLSERFLTHLTETLPRAEIGQLGNLAVALKEPHLAVMIGKRAASRGLTLHAAYYPLHPLIEGRLPVVPELALSIARRESEFDPVVVSGAGARGLMQLMPRTAQQVSGELGIRYNLQGLTSDPEYNARLGSTYLAGLVEEFGTAYPLVAAGYNAGPSRPIRWMERYGDPRRERTDPVDWIEHIPFRETRNYVMRVMESMIVYRARLSGQTSPITLSEELRRTR